MSLIPFGFWAASGAGGGGGAFDLLETTTLTSSASSVTFSGLGAYSDYKHLQIRYTARCSEAFSTGSIYIHANGDTAANYSAHYLRGNGSAVSSAAFTSTSTPYLATMVGSLAASGAFASGVIDILDFTNANKNTTFRALSGVDYPSSSAWIRLASALWNNTAAVTSMTLEPQGLTLITGSRFSLYGVK